MTERMTPLEILDRRIEALCICAGPPVDWDGTTGYMVAGWAHIEMDKLLQERYPADSRQNKED